MSGIFWLRIWFALFSYTVRFQEKTWSSCGIHERINKDPAIQWSWVIIKATLPVRNLLDLKYNRNKRLLKITGNHHIHCKSGKGKGKGFPYSVPSVGPGADPSVQAVSLQVTVSHPPSGRLPLLSARPAVTSPAAEHHHPLAGTKLYCLVTEAHRCKQLA